MGTYTANKNLYMPSVGETGWGTLMNTNISTIDNFLKPITVSGSTYTFTGNQSGGSISATSITNSGTLTNTGKITGNGGIAGTTGTFSGAVTAKNIVQSGLIPYTLCLFGSSSSDGITSTFGNPIHNNSIAANNYVQITLCNRIGGGMAAGATLTKQVYPHTYSLGNVPIINVHDYKIYSGSWNIKICCDADATVTVKNINSGLTISDITTTGKSITRAQINTLMSSLNQYTIKANSDFGSNGITVSIRFYNTSSVEQSALSRPSGLV